MRSKINIVSSYFVIISFIIYITSCRYQNVNEETIKDYGAFSNESKLKTVTNFIKQTHDSLNYAIFIDMSKPSKDKRLFLVQLDSNKIIFATHVAHGKGSDVDDKAVIFSDSIDSHCTSLGLYRTGNKYYGKHGESYELIGLEKSNSNALKRNIVIHSASYVSRKFINEHGRCGRSWGCPAISVEALEILAPFLSKRITIYIYT